MRATTLLAADVLKLWTTSSSSSWSHSQETNRPINQCIAAPTGRIITAAAGGRAECSLTMLRCVCSGVKNETLLCCANVVLRDKQEYGGVCISCVHSFSTTCYSVQQRWRRKQRTGGDVLARGHGCALISTLTHLAPTRLLTWNSGERTDSWGRAAVSPVNNLQRQAFTACWPALRAEEDIDPHWHVMYKLLQSFSGLRWINDQF